MASRARTYGAVNRLSILGIDREKNRLRIGQLIASKALDARRSFEKLRINSSDE
jgi:hypothetical protein